MNKKPSQKDTKKIELSKKLASLFSKKAWKETRELWIGAGVLVAVAALAGWVFFSSLPTTDVEQNPGEEIAALDRHPLTGEVIAEPYTVLPQVFGVMIENAADAWPLSGIDKAFLVIEAPVEAGIPRFIAFFSEEDSVEKIGPVRSARPYYVDWADGLQAIYAHVGGSPAALEQIAQGNTLDVNQFWFGEYFWRENGTRYAPHNVYTNTELLVEVIEEAFSLEEPSYDLWSFASIEPIANPIEDITIDFADGTLYAPVWTYSVGRNAYLRDQSGYTWLEGGAETWADNVIVIAMDIRTIDNVGRKSIESVGTGNALLFNGGDVALVTWRKDAQDDRLVFEKNGEEVTFAPGVTWIEVVSDLDQVEYE